MKTSRFAIAAMLTCAFAVLASQSSGGAATTAGSAVPINVAAAKKLLAQQEKPTKWRAPGPSFTVNRSAMKGKSVYIVASQGTADFTLQLVAGAKAAGKLFGMKVQAVDAQGSPANAIRLVNQGISQNVDAIVIISFPTVVVKTAVEAAKAKGIPVVIVGEQDAGLPTAAQKSAGVFGNTGQCTACAGREMAIAAVALSGGKPFKTTYVNVPSSEVTIEEQAAFKAELTKLCSGCQFEVKSVDFAQWGTQLTPTASAAITTGSQLIVPAYDAMVPLMLPAVAQSNAIGKVSFNSYNATAPVLADLAQGRSIQADVGSSNAWIGWATMDQVLRALNGRPPTPGAVGGSIPDRTFTKNNIGGVNLKADPATWTGPVVFPQQYAKLWHAT